MSLQRPSLARVAAIQIKENILKGEWGKQLPGGRELARLLGVSRPVIYQALRQLETEGVLAGSKKSAREVRPSDLGYRPRASKVVFLSPYQIEELEELPSHLAAMLGRSLADDGLRLEFARLARVDKKASSRSLDSLMRLHNPRAWVLYRCAPQVQEWFLTHALPCLVFGSRPDGISLPRVDVDYAAAARHLAGRARALGHVESRILLITPADQLAGHVLAAEALFGESRKDGAMIGLSGDPDEMAGQIDNALERRPSLIVTQRAIHAKMVVSRLWAKGLRCPSDLSLVSLQDSASLALLRPAVTRYTVSQEALFKAAARAMSALLSGNACIRQGKLLLPEIVTGDTLGPAT